MPSSGVQTCALRSEEHTSELQSHDNLVCRLLLEKNRWNKTLAKNGVQGLSLARPPRRFHGGVGPYATARFDPQGRMISEFFFKEPGTAWLITLPQRGSVQS